MNRFLGILLASAMATPLGMAGGLQSANVTKVINDVRIYRPDTAARKARTGDLVRGRTSLQTGRRSKSELRFQDQTITRLGANSVFSFEQGTRDLTLNQGTLLLQVPKNAGGARINTPTVTAAVTGTTIMMEYFANKWAKTIVLEGSLDVWTNINGRDKKVSIRAGEMAVFRANDRRVPKPVKVDLGRLMKTSALADPGTFGNLPRHATEKIREAMERQNELKRDGFLTPVVRGRDNSPFPSSGGSDRARDISDDQKRPDRETLAGSGSASPGDNDNDDGGFAPDNDDSTVGGDNDDDFGDNDDAGGDHDDDDGGGHDDNGLHVGQIGDEPPRGGREK